MRNLPFSPTPFSQKRRRQLINLCGPLPLCVKIPWGRCRLVFNAEKAERRRRRGRGAGFSTGLTGWAGLRAGLGAARDHGSGWRRRAAPALGGPQAESRASTHPPTAPPLRCVASPPPDTEARSAGH